MRSRSRRFGFTLIEMLVVTIIIGILVSLVSVAVMYALGTGKVARVSFEAQEMTRVMQTISLGSSGFPPADLRMANATDYNSAVAKWFRNNYPQYDLTTLHSDLATAGVSTTVFDPGVALVFWLVGFDPDPARPLNNHAARMTGSTPEARKAWKHDFDMARLVKPSGSNTPRYLMPGESVVHDDKDGDNVVDAGEKYRAYVYYDSASYPVDFAGFHCYCDGAPGYIYFNPDGCQIVCAGRDEVLGTGGSPPGAAIPYGGFDADNIANFGEGGTMKDYIEKLKKL